MRPSRPLHPFGCFHAVFQVITLIFFWHVISLIAMVLAFLYEHFNQHNFTHIYNTTTIIIYHSTRPDIGKVCAICHKQENMKL